MIFGDLLVIFDGREFFGSYARSDEFVDGVVIESCKRVDLHADDLWRDSWVDVFFSEIVPCPSMRLKEF